MDSYIYPRLNGDLEPAQYRLSPDEIAKIEGDEATGDTFCLSKNSAVPRLGPPADDALFRCGCGKTGVHINAWGELGTCTWVYEARSDLRRKSVREAINEVFPKIRAMKYQSDSPCKSCQVHLFCDKMPSTFRLEAGDPEKPVRHFCDTAVARAEQTLQQKVAHPYGIRD
ncbi:MAG: hypothetical protein HY609_00790 [Deltaproteobacteria bacterium]|nr:hypothetical protein [Deltaproteobacteria bacterium]